MESNASSVQLIRLAAQHMIPLVGIFARDELPAKLGNGGYIVNMDDSAGPGTHWTAFYIDGRKAAYFDSFGVEPPLEVIRALKPYKYTINRKVIQNPASGYCGMYCLVFIWMMRVLKDREPKLRDRLKTFQKLWSENVEDNLRVLKYFVDVVPKRGPGPSSTPRFSASS